MSVWIWVGHPDDGSKGDGTGGGDECAGGAMLLTRRSPAEGGDSEIGGDGDGLVMARSLSTSALWEGIMKLRSDGNPAPMALAVVLGSCVCTNIGSRHPRLMKTGGVCGSSGYIFSSSAHRKKGLCTGSERCKNGSVDDVHPDELCPPKKGYDLVDANKKVDLEHEDGLKYRLRFMLDKKELSLTLDDFGIIFHLPQANDNNHNSFVPPPTFSDMVPFYKQLLGFTVEQKTSSSFKTTGLLQPWQTLCKIFYKCLTTRVTGWDQPPLQIMKMMYCFVNNIHVDYAELLWEGIYYSLHHPTSLILYPRFTKIIVSHYMTIFPEISRRARDMYHNLMYAEVFGLDVPLTQSQPTKSTHGTHRTPSAP
ncbi:hypothetical protein Tco_0744210, partial [Tanacetum coccineum]